MVNRIKFFYRDEGRRRLLDNFTSLGVLQIANYLLPLVTIPYLVRVLGPEQFGLVAFSQSFIQFFVVLNDYGFNLSATREISKSQGVKSVLAEIFVSTMFIKAILLLVSLVILGFVVTMFGSFREEWPLHVFSFGMVLGNALFPVWYFQGIERMRYVTILTVLAKVFFTILVFVFVRTKSDYLMVPLLNSLGYIGVGIIGSYLCLKDLPIRNLKLQRIGVKTRFMESSKFFISFFFSKIFTSSGIFFIGLFFNNTIAGYYAVIEKLILTFKALLNPISQSLYPFFAKKEFVENFILNKYFKFCLVSTVMVTPLCFVIYFYADPIVILFFGEKFLPSAGILRFLVPQILISYLYIMLGFHVFLPMGRDREFLVTVIVPALFFIIFAPFCVWIKRDFHVFLVVLLASEFLVLFFRITYFYKFKREYILR